MLEMLNTPTRPMGTVHTEKMLAIPGMLEFRLGMVHANGGQALEYTRRSVEAIVGHQALKFDWRAGEVVEEDLLVKCGRVGIVSIDAPVFFAGSIWTAILGGVTVGEITKAVYAALNDPEIETVVLDMDCPGGQVAGIGELVEAIDTLAASKTVVTYVHEMAASLAYWMASRTHRVVSNSSGEVGSIGAIAIAYDTSGWFREEGIRVIPLTEAEQKTFGHMGIEISDEMIERAMGTIREIGAQFRASVSAKTGIDEASLMGLQGSMHYAGSALALGLIDEVMTPSAFYAAVQAGAFDNARTNETTTPTSGEAAAQQEVQTMSTIDIKSMTAEQKAELRAALAEDKKNDEEMEDEDDTPTSEDDKKEEPKGEDDEEEKPAATDDEDEDDTPAASAMTIGRAQKILAPHKLPEAVANKLTITAVKKNQSETELLSACIAAVQQNASTAAIEQEAGGDPSPIGGGRGNASNTATKGKGAAQANIDAEAAKLVESNPGMSMQQARGRVVRTNPALRDALVAEANA